MIRTTIDIDLSRKEVIQTEHLIFRCLDREDIPQLMELTRDPKLIENAIMRVDFTEESFGEFLDSLPKTPTPAVTMFGMFMKDDPTELYGMISYTLISLQEAPRMSLWIRERHRRRRMFSEVVPALLDFAFLVHRLDAIHADAFPCQRMTPTMALKYGFKFIGYRREFAAMQGREIIMSVMELTRTDWLANREQFVRRSSMVHPLPQRSLSPQLSSLA
ncbi:GNAT family N-acetyltransferase [Rhodoligotrophos ferricapiens]|uniref:GNAT family N-acetyltransferase n=1 Tax=Rhodoligotrophos ferricapiens TaxID=3069264 RepID=UPI00315D537B